jgi:hypothetical protein
MRAVFTPFLASLLCGQETKTTIVPDRFGRLFRSSGYSTLSLFVRQFHPFRAVESAHSALGNTIMFPPCSHPRVRSVDLRAYPDSRIGRTYVLYMPLKLLIMRFSDR